VSPRGEPQQPRLQATLFLPPPVNELVEDIRRRWDPAMATLVSAHVTLVYEVDDPGVFLQRLARVARATTPLEFTLTHAACWGSPAGGIYLAVDDSLGAISALRRSLLVTDGPGVAYRPHVTLVHPRSATSAHAEAAWSLLRDVRVDQRVTIHDVALIRNAGHGWELMNRTRLMGRAEP
jgi:2'-5' RNA ligase